jgi:hypothetical protein
VYIADRCAAFSVILEPLIIFRHGPHSKFSQSASSLVRHQHWAWRGRHRKHSFIYCSLLDLCVATRWSKLLEYWQKEIVVHWEGLFRKITELLQHRLQQNWILILKTPFPQKISDVSFTNPTFTVRLQLLNVWLLKVMLRCVKDCVPSRQTLASDNRKRPRNVVHHAVPYISKSLRLENTQGSLQLGFRSFNIESREGGCSVIVWATILWYNILLVPLLPFMEELLQGSTWTGWLIRCAPIIPTLFPNNDAVFKEDNVPYLRSSNCQSWFEEHESKIQYFPWPAHSPD